ncbi:hypothetical protein D3C72_2319410 [compost metagenome]
MQFSSQASSECSATWDCMKMVDLAGSMPQAMYSAATSRHLARNALGSMASGMVMACRSTTQKMLSKSSWFSAHWLMAPT